MNRKTIAYVGIGVAVLLLADYTISKGDSILGSLGNSVKAVGIVAAGGIGAWILLFLFP